MTTNAKIQKIYKNIHRGWGDWYETLYFLSIALTLLCETLPKPRLLKARDISSTLYTGAQLGWGRWGRAPPPAFHTLAKGMSLNRGLTHFTFGLRP